MTDTADVSETPASDLSFRDQLATAPMDPKLKDIQPGSGIIVKWELCWGRFRRWCLRTFRKGYVAKMQGCRQGDFNGCPFEPIDSRDLKYYRNQGGYYWKPEDDRFRWRDKLPFARVGLAELLVCSVFYFGGAGLLTWLTIAFANTTAWRITGWLAVTTFAVIGLLIVWFFRDPHRKISQVPGTIVSPADGKVVLIEEIEHDEFLEGPAILIGIFLSIFNVHINRTPMAGRVLALRYREGKFLNALRPESARENEQLAIYLETSGPNSRRMIVRQITGAIARRIVCWLKPGDELEVGEQIGMIKLGSRTELVLPKEEGLELLVKLGQNIKAGSTELGRYA